MTEGSEQGRLRPLAFLIPKIEGEMMIEKNRVYNMDCLDFMSNLPDHSIDLIIADPPYFEVKGEFDFIYENEKDYLSFIEETIIQFKRVLKPTGSLYIYSSQQMGAKFDLMLRNYFDIKNRLIWYRTGGVSPSKKFKLSHEPLFYCVNDLSNHTWNVDDIRIKSKYAEKDKRLNPKGKVPDDVWEIPNLVGRKKEKVDHPTQKPLALCDRIVKVSSNEGELVYVPFGGSGSEIVSCILNNRAFVSTELNKDYIKNLIEPRIANLKQSI